ncbi:hypothetical protein [Paenibacillus sp. TAF43_2]
MSTTLRLAAVIGHLSGLGSRSKLFNIAFCKTALFKLLQQEPVN